MRSGAKCVSLKPDQSHKLLICTETTRLEAEGVCFALIIGYPSKPFGACFRELVDQRQKLEVSGRNSRRFEEENKSFSCIKSQQQSDLGLLQFCLHLLPMISFLGEKRNRRQLMPCEVILNAKPTDRRLYTIYKR